MEGPEGLEIFVVEPRNYDEILLRSKSTPKPYSREDLERLYMEGRNTNRAVLISFMDQSFWERGRK